MDVTLDDVCVCRAPSGLWMWCEVMCVSPLGAYMCVTEKRACRGWVSAWFISEYPPWLLQIFLYVRLCLVTKSALCFPKRDFFCVRLMNLMNLMNRNLLLYSIRMFSCVFIRVSVFYVTGSHIGGIHLLFNSCWCVWKYNLTMILKVQTLIHQIHFVSHLKVDC